MGVYRAGVRVTRPLTPLPSCSSSDDDDDLVRKSKVRKTLSENLEVGLFPHMSQDVSDLHQVGEATCRLPEEIFELESLGDVLSLQSWNDILSEDERQQLCSNLPEMEWEDFQRTLRDLLSGQNMYFGSPLENLWQQLKGGLCNPDVLASRKALISLQRREYYHNLRNYHDGMVHSLREMRELWMCDPTGNLEEKLNNWNSHKPSGSLQTVKTSHIRDRSKCLAPAMEIASDGMMIDKSLESGPGHAVQCANEEWPSHVNLKSNKKRRNSRSKKSALPPASSQGQGGANRSKMDFKDKALQEDLWVNRVAPPLESPASRNYQSRCIPSKQLKAQECMDASDRATQDGRYDLTNVDDFQSMMMTSSNITDGRVPGFGSDKQIQSSFQQNYPDDVTPIRQKPRATWAFSSTLNPGVTFSTLSFLSAVRASFVDASSLVAGEQKLPFKEVVARVESCPGDAQVLKVHMPLDCLVRGALKSLSSSSKVLTMDGYEPFVSYNKATRHWSWDGKVSGRVCTFREADLHAMSKVWSISTKILGDLLDCFEKWLKNMEMTLQRLWQLAQIQMPLFPVFANEKERFGDLRAQKRSSTIPLSSYEIRTLFQKEESVRYSSAEIAFRYTAADGKKSAVAPLKKLGGKSKAKARDHFMLVTNRPSHITVLCLVRDAAARLPQGIGTRADVCTLLQDSQFVENVSEPQLNHVVSGALDRLHYERDPCVVFNQDQRLWHYLHGNREEEDFDEGGTVSTRISRRKAVGGLSRLSPAQDSSFHDNLSEEADSDPFNFYAGRTKPASPEFPYERSNQGRIRLGLVQEKATSRPHEEIFSSFVNLQTSLQPFCGAMDNHPMGWEVCKGGQELSIRH